MCGGIISHGTIGEEMKEQHIQYFWNGSCAFEMLLPLNSLQCVLLCTFPFKLQTWTLFIDHKKVLLRERKRHTARLDLTHPSPPLWLTHPSPPADPPLPPADPPLPQLTPPADPPLPHG